jgi:hypothetical protein
MKIKNHDDFPKLDHRAAPSFREERDRAARSTGEFSNGTSGENYSGILTTGHTDMRKGFDGLAVLESGEFSGRLRPWSCSCTLKSCYRALAVDTCG